MGGKKKYINIFGSFTEPFICDEKLSVNANPCQGSCNPNPNPPKGSSPRAAVKI